MGAMHARTLPAGQGILHQVPDRDWRKVHTCRWLVHLGRELRRLLPKLPAGPRRSYTVITRKQTHYTHEPYVSDGMHHIHISNAASNVATGRSMLLLRLAWLGLALWRIGMLTLLSAHTQLRNSAWAGRLAVVGCCGLLPESKARPIVPI